MSSQWAGLFGEGQAGGRLVRAGGAPVRVGAVGLLGESRPSGRLSFSPLSTSTRVTRLQHVGGVGRTNARPAATGR
ncbi:hypothetical protein DLJ46_21395 [Micromonospora globispora]|uniref:Uncharacterized protein n=1 Tax=Micromonospora globispora TaxID=1450148 RepID=A0A317JXF2_9ACTN|nr:hypothetical protein DLJ46_21395 [Micromonospora globispora]RQW98800.1 hypothetical protein DKL51_09710 [Micromonospora globispora]